jgi:hypothetical protein
MALTARSGGMQSHRRHKDLADSLKNTMVFVARPWAAKRIPHHRPGREALVVKKDFFDLTKLIRSIQRAEGNPDCFGRAQGYCDRLDCAWRQYCLDKPQDKATAYKNKQTVAHNHESSENRQFPR